MAEDDIGLTASTALNVHEIGVRGGDKSFKLVGLALLLDGGVEEVSVHFFVEILR